MSNNQQQSQQSRPSNTVEQQKKEQPPKAIQQEAPKQLCQIHSKKLEAFCEKDLQVLCIDCILSEQHKSHEIISVQKAVDKQKQQMFEEVTLAQKSEEKLRLIQNDIKRHISDMHQQADKNRKELSSIYSYLRELILERETTLKRQISENLTRDEQDGDSKLYELSEFVGMIQMLKQELVNQSQESEIEVLQKARARTLIFTEVNGPRAKDLSSFNIGHFQAQCMSLNEIKRDQELG